VLDLGCGDGWFGRMLFPPGLAVALDRDHRSLPGALAVGRYLAAAGGDASRLPFRDACVRTVVANSALEHLDDLPAALAEIRRVLVPGGVLLCTVPGTALAGFIAGETLPGLTGRWCARRLEEHLEHRQVADPPWWRARLAAAGLTLRRAEAILPRRAVSLWVRGLPGQWCGRRLNRLVPLYRLLEGPRRRLLEGRLASLTVPAGEEGAAWLLDAAREG
jgi:SAM-dependent methyltransferase